MTGRMLGQVGHERLACGRFAGRHQSRRVVIALQLTEEVTGADGHVSEKEDGQRDETKTTRSHREGSSCSDYQGDMYNSVNSLEWDR